MRYVLFTFLVLSGLRVQSQVYQQYDLALRLGYGFVNTLKMDLDLDVVDYDKGSGNIEPFGGLGPFVLDAEYLLFEDFSVGISYSYNRFDLGWKYNETNYSDPDNPVYQEYEEKLAVKNQSFFVMATAHFSDFSFQGKTRGETSNMSGYSVGPTSFKRLDLYVSLGLGFRKIGFDFESNAPDAFAPKLDKRWPLRVLFGLGTNVYLTQRIAWNFNMGFNHSCMARTGFTFRISPKK